MLASLIQNSFSRLILPWLRYVVSHPNALSSMATRRWKDTPFDGSYPGSSDSINMWSASIRSRRARGSVLPLGSWGSAARRAVLRGNRGQAHVMRTCCKLALTAEMPQLFVIAKSLSFSSLAILRWNSPHLLFHLLYKRPSGPLERGLRHVT